MARDITVSSKGDFCSGVFTAMASPCEILVDTTDINLTRKLCRLGAKEAWRIEDKYSRYNPASVCSSINNSQGKSITIDDETYLLLQFADQCYQISGGLFDITSGVLRKAWRFDGSNKIPSEAQVSALLADIGWQRVTFDPHQIHLPRGMELDFGGIGKEYAVDKVAQRLKQMAPQHSIVVNFGGDLAITSPKDDQTSWTIGIENPAAADGGEEKPAKAALSIKQGALATSGDARRFLLKDGIRYSHILNPKTGWPVADAPRSVTVAAPQCIQAGILATIALLQGADAEAFLQAQEVKYWCVGAAG